MYNTVILWCKCACCVCSIINSPLTHTHTHTRTHTRTHTHIHTTDAAVCADSEAGELSAAEQVSAGDAVLHRAPGLHKLCRLHTHSHQCLLRRVSRAYIVHVHCRIHVPVHVRVHVLIRDEKEGRKKQARSNKQGKATQHTQGIHFS